MNEETKEYLKTIKEEFNKGNANAIQDVIDKNHLIPTQIFDLLGELTLAVSNHLFLSGR